MKTMFALLRQKRLRTVGMIAACGLAAGMISAQVPARRILSEANYSAQATLKGSLHPQASPQNDAGRMPADTRLSGMSIYFNRSAAQEADLQALLAAQQDPASPQYHQWLNPDQFAARFGMAQADLEAVENWLQQQGFSVDSVSRSHNVIRFSGTVGQVEAAFQTQMHYYQADGEKRFAPSTALSVPAAFAPTIAAVRNLDSFRPKAQHIVPRGQFTSGQSGNVFFAPGDIATAYDLAPLTSGGVNGLGQTIAIMGQSAVVTSDITAFQTAAGLPSKAPNMVLVPDTGASTLYSGDESESDLDLEWSSAMAPGATIDFVYTGFYNNNGVFDSLQYAIDQKLAQIISLSYSVCEQQLTQANVTSFEAVLKQAAAQGQTVLAASGDQGATACEGMTNSGLTATQLSSLTVNYPASSAYVLGVGGTEISSANSVSSNSTYWQSASGSDVSPSLKTYIPETSWNDSSKTTQTSIQNGGGLAASGGGTSMWVQRPSWQTGVPGIASGSFRLVPDVALYSSSIYPGYLYCTSDQSAWASGQTGSCGNGFRAGTSDTSLTVAGGTSFATPIFAGMVALLNQKLNYNTGQGLINPTLYQLAANSSVYASAFHDVTSGNNNCVGGSTFCGTQTGGYSAGTGYDEVTGLGSVDLGNLVAALTPNTGASAGLIGSTTSITVSNSTPNIGDTVTFTIAVAGVTGSGVPTGSVSLSLDGAGTAYGASGATTVTVPLTANGTATYSTSFSTAGTHQLVAQYAGDATYASSTGTASVAVPAKGNIAVAASSSTLTLSHNGAQGTETVTVTPSNGFIGTVVLGIDFGSSDTALANLCGGFANASSQGFGSVTISGASAATIQLSLDTNAADCATAAAVSRTGMRPLKDLIGTKTSKNNVPSGIPMPASIAFAGLVLVGFFGRKSRALRNSAMVLALAVAGLAFTACGGGSSSSGSGSSGGGSSSTANNPPKGTYTGTISAQDLATSSVKAQTTFTFVIN